jgi:hypothetical protein
MPGDSLKIRVIAPDLWREERMEFAPDTPVAAVKERALPVLFGANETNPSDYYVEYLEKEVPDEGTTLAGLKIRDGAVISIRRYDIDHPKPFDG